MNVNNMGSVTDPIGFKAAGIHAGIRNKKGKYDLCLIYSEKPTVTAGTFTQNVFQAAPVIVSREHIQEGNPRAIVVNSRVANACTGAQGLEDARKMAHISGEVLGVSSKEVVVASTGIIGETLPIKTIEAGIRSLGTVMSDTGGIDAASAIMTTDTREKHVSVTGDIGGRKVTIGGIAKGSGMIHPNMATMLSFITTDCAIDKSLLQKALGKSVDQTYNMITVDGDTSTNDMVVCLANGCAENPQITDENEDFQVFFDMLQTVNTYLAKEIVLDGEGAKKMIEVTVSGGHSFSAVKSVVMSVLNSNLVKTAFFGEDANWGRIIAAMGYSGVDFLPEDVHVYLEDLQVVSKGKGLAFDEDHAADILAKPEISVKIRLGTGPYKATGYGTDLSYEYVKINGSYRS